MSDKNNEKTSFLDKVREINERERLEAEAEEERLRIQREEREKQRKIAYQNKLRQEKIELMKLKSGIISEDDIPKEEVVEKHYTIPQKIGNFFYHNKAYLIFGALLAMIAGMLIYDFVSRERPDMTILYIHGDFEVQFLTKNAGEIFEPYCDDVNGDGEVLVNVYYIPVEYDDGTTVGMETVQADRTKLVAEFQAGEAIMVIGSQENYEMMGIDNAEILTDMSTVYPDDENAQTFGYKLSATTFEDALGIDLPDDELYISFRTPRKLMGTNYENMEKNYKQALEVFDRYIAENKKAE